MSSHGVKAVLEAAAQDPELKTMLEDSASFDATVQEILTLTSEESTELKNTFHAKAEDEIVVEQADERNNPGPGYGI